jgi:hypothetical protein
MTCRLLGWLLSDEAICRFPYRGVARNRNGIPASGVPAADRRQRDRLLRWAAPFEPRVWAVEGATGHGTLLAQQLVACGERVVDVPAALSEGTVVGLGPQRQERCA